MEEVLIEYVEQLREKRWRVTHKMLRVEARRLFAEYVGSELDKFKDVMFNASVGSYVGFCERHEFTIHARTTVAQNPPYHYTDKIVNFLVFVRKLRKEKKYMYPMSGIYGCNETPVWFENVGNRTLDAVEAGKLLCTALAMKKCAVLSY